MILAAAVLGLLIGSFLNVCIYRLPKDESVVRPRSRCIFCGQTIRWYDNIPVLSFLLLRGRCRECGGTISWQYPLVEAATAVLFVVIAMRFGPTLAGVRAAVFVAMMLALGVADLNDRILPDEITLGGAAAGVLFSLLHPLPPGIAAGLAGLSGWHPGRLAASLLESLAGAAISAGLLWGVAEAYYRIRFREGMGLGDVKMMLLIGAFFGVLPAFWTVLLASVLGAVIGLVFVILFRKGMAYELPFGTFLAMAGILVMVWGHEAV
jgi:leader peptidase (prepilin peptidase)/N-methyltransferase